MGRSQETFNKKEVRNKKEKKKKDKEAKRLARKESGEKSGSLDDMIAYVDENGMITDTPPDPTKKKKIIAENIELGVPKREDEADYDPIRKGVVTFFNDGKGFGFIKDSVTQESVFVHINNTTEEIKENNMVIFEVEKGPKGLTAVNVKVDR